MSGAEPGLGLEGLLAAESVLGFEVEEGELLAAEAVLGFGVEEEELFETGAVSGLELAEAAFWADRRRKDGNNQYSGIGLGESGTGSLRWEFSFNRYIIGDKGRYAQ